MRDEKLLVLYKPLIKAIMGVFGIYALSLVVHPKLVSPGTPLFKPDWLYLGWFIAGALYTHFFEYFYHRFALHKGLPALKFLKKSHTQHHWFFNDPNFQRRDLEALQNITTKWYVFPLLFIGHYLFALKFVSHEYIPTLFLGIIIHFSVFEISHWFTHVKGNLFDKIMLQVPVFGRCRAWQIRHHRIHHDWPLYNFNFTIPALGDEAFRTLSPNELET